jgi:xanthine/uracil/vitamin C permease (AzgA family)
MMKVIPPSIQMGVTAGIFLASILLKAMRYLVYKKYLWITWITYITSSPTIAVLCQSCYPAEAP